jgi:DNA-damage-inducible protein D
MNEQNELIAFEGTTIRKIWHNEQWYFSIVDVIEVLTESPNPRNYWSMLKRKDNQLYTIPVQLKMTSPDGKKYKTDAANTEGVFRIIMSVPSPKAEPLKLWMAQTSSERIEETENPEIGFERLREIYKAKGYTNEWIERPRNIKTSKDSQNLLKICETT